MIKMSESVCQCLCVLQQLGCCVPRQSRGGNAPPGYNRKGTELMGGCKQWQCTVGSVWSGEAAGSNPENCYLHLAQARPEAHRWRKLLQRIC